MIAVGTCGGSDCKTRKAPRVSLAGLAGDTTLCSDLQIWPQSPRLLDIIVNPETYSKI
jgi:hypothetical protein